MFAAIPSRHIRLDEAECLEAVFIDKLSYDYAPDGVRLSAVTDGAESAVKALGYDGSGFYRYDENGNLELDGNKSLSFEVTFR